MTHAHIGCQSRSLVRARLIARVLCYVRQLVVILIVYLFIYFYIKAQIVSFAPRKDWPVDYFVLSPSVAVGGVEECGIFMNEITTEAGVPASPLIGRPRQNRPSSS